MNTTLLTLLSAIGLAFVVSACGGGGGDNSVTNPTTYSVTPSVSSSGGAISPSNAVSVNSGATATFTLTPNSGYSASVAGTCGGTLSGNTYTTKAITGNCTVVASFAATSQTYTVTPSVSGSGALTPSTAVSVKPGQTASFLVLPGSGPGANYSLVSVNGTCGGTLNGLTNTYTTNAVNTNCTVVATFAQNATGSGAIAACFTIPYTPPFSFAVDPNQYPDQNSIYKVDVATSLFLGGSASANILYYNAGYPIIDSSYTSKNFEEVIFWNITANNVLRLGNSGQGSLFPNQGNSNGYANMFISITNNPVNAIPLNLQAGQSIDYTYTQTTATSISGIMQYNDQQSSDYTSRTTFIGLETITLAGKTFSNVCHFKGQDLIIDKLSQPTANWEETWVAPGYGIIKDVQHDSAGSHIFMQYGGPAS